MTPTAQSKSSAAPDTAEGSPVRQLTVFLQNRVGALMALVDQLRVEDRVRSLLGGPKRQQANGRMPDGIELAAGVCRTLPEQAVELAGEFRDQSALDDELHALKPDLTVHPVSLDPVGRRDDDGVGKGFEAVPAAVRGI